MRKMYVIKKKSVLRTSEEIFNDASEGFLFSSCIIGKLSPLSIHRKKASVYGLGIPTNHIFTQPTISVAWSDSEGQDCPF